MTENAGKQREDIMSHSRIPNGGKTKIKLLIPWEVNRPVIYKKEGDIRARESPVFT